MISHESIESMLDSFNEGESFGEAAPFRGVRTPNRQSSFQATNPNVASQAQVQSAARNLDSKIETLSNAVKALETRTNTLAASQDRVVAGVKREIDDRKKNTDGIRGELQQTKTLSVLMPLLTQESTVITDVDGNHPTTVLTKPTSAISTLLPFMLLMSPSSTDGAKGPFGDSTMTMLLLVMLMDRNKPAA